MPSYGTLTTAWIAATGETDLTILGALNTLESDLTTYGLTAKMKAVYPMVGGTAAKHKFNFMDARDLDAAFRLVFIGGWTHSSNGITGNSVNTYADTKIIPLTHLNNFNSSFSIYNRTSGYNAGFEGGVISSGNWYGHINYDASFPTGHAIQGSRFMIATIPNDRNLVIFNRTANNNANIFINNSKITTNTSTSTDSRANSNIYLGAVNWVGFGTAYPSNRNIALASIGDGLTDTEAANFYTAVQAFQTTLGRQVA